MAEKVSIIIPAYNEESYIKDTLKSIENNKKSYKDIEIIVVCDSCTDKTFEIASKVKDVKIFSVSGKKASIAKNKGAKHAVSDFYIFLDADTRLSKDAIKEVMKELIANQGKSVGTLKVSPYPKKKVAIMMMWIKNLIFWSRLYPGTNGVIFCSKELFDKIGGFDENLSCREDGNFMKRAKALARYSFIRKAHVETSMRRFEVVGYLNVLLFWIIVGIKELFRKKQDNYKAIR